MEDLRQPRNQMTSDFVCSHTAHAGKGDAIALLSGRRKAFPAGSFSAVHHLAHTLQLAVLEKL